MKKILFWNRRKMMVLKIKSKSKESKKTYKIRDKRLSKRLRKKSNNLSHLNLWQHVQNLLYKLLSQQFYQQKSMLKKSFKNLQ